MYGREGLGFIGIEYLIENVEIYEEVDGMILEELEGIKGKLSKGREEWRGERIEGVGND